MGWEMGTWELGLCSRDLYVLVWVYTICGGYFPRFNSLNFQRAGVLAYR
jgi:hypothetical protein